MAALHQSSLTEKVYCMDQIWHQVHVKFSLFNNNLVKQQRATKQVESISVLLLQRLINSLSFDSIPLVIQKQPE